MPQTYIKLTPHLESALQATLKTLANDCFASRTFKKDPSLWGCAVEADAAQRLGWVDLFTESRSLLPRIKALRELLDERDIERIVLVGMGGSSLAPEVMTYNSKIPLVILDSTHPDAVKPLIESDLRNTVVIVSSKSGTTLETDSLRRVFEKAFEKSRLAFRDHMIAVTDSNSDLDTLARKKNYLAVFNANPTVGGRYSALTAFGLVPSGLAGVDVASLLNNAEELVTVLREDSASNPGLQLGAALASFSKVSLKVTDGPSTWVEQLIAESTGKDGRGILPVLSNNESLPDALIVNADSVIQNSIEVHGSLGARFMLWEFATAVAGNLLEVNPFDQPDVESSKSSTLKKLSSQPLLRTVTPIEDLTKILNTLLKSIPENGYLAIHSYLNQHADPRIEQLREILEAKTDHAVTFGWGPRFLHSTGQFHKGGPRIGVFLQLVDDSRADVAIPGKGFTLDGLITSQAEGDRETLESLGLRVFRICLSTTEVQVEQLLTAASVMLHKSLRTSV